MSLSVILSCRLSRCLARFLAPDQTSGSLSWERIVLGQPRRSGPSFCSALTPSPAPALRAALTPSPAPALRERGELVDGLGIVDRRRRSVATTTLTLPLPLAMEELKRTRGKVRGQHLPLPLAVEERKRARGKVRGQHLPLPLPQRGRGRGLGGR